MIQRKRKSLFTLAIVATLAIAGLAGTSQGAGLYHADGLIGSAVDGRSQTPFQSYALDLGVEAGGGVNYDVFGPGIPSFHAQASSLADGFGLHAHTSAQYIVIPPALGFFNDYALFGNSTAWLIYSDVVVTGPVGGTVSTSLNLTLDGSHSGSVTADPGIGPAIASSTVNVAVSINGVGVGDGHHDVSVSSTSDTIRTVGLHMLANGVGNIVTPAFNVQVGVPFAVKLEMDTQAFVEGLGSNFGGLTAAANTDFSNTLSFALAGPVFNLPGGYTADSADAGIVSNSFVVPEPSSLLLLGMGCIGFYACRRPVRATRASTGVATATGKRAFRTS
jgi:hypothetical protein